jgi:hypothetical protein
VGDRQISDSTTGQIQGGNNQDHRYERLSQGYAIQNTVLGVETLDDISTLTGMLNPPVNSALG